MPVSDLRRTAAATVCLVLAALAALAVLAVTGPATTALSGTAGGASSAVEHRWGSPVRASAAGPAPYAFATVLDGQPVRWNPCAPIRWTANLSGAPAGGLQVLQAAVARVAAASGTRWTYVGPSRTVPTSAALPARAGASYPPVLIGWTDGARSDLLRGQRKDVLGMTRTTWFGVQHADGRKVAAVRAAVIALDRTDRLPLRGPVSWHAVALHELGHTMGLAHVGDRRQLMASVLPRVSDLQAGDRTGLARVGRSAGCVVLPTGR